MYLKKRIIIKKYFFLAIYLFLIWSQSFSQALKHSASKDWKYYAASNYSTKYTSLSQVDSSNFAKLIIAWRWQSIDQPLLDRDTTLKTWKNESTPLKIGVTLYTSTSLSQVAAINANNGLTIWQYNPGTYKNGPPPNLGFLNRGLAYWQNKKDKRIYLATADAYLVAINCSSGQPVTSFGEQGRIDLTRGLRREIERVDYGVTSPPLICNDVIIVGSNILDYPRTAPMPPGDVRGYDIVTGKLLWTFKSIPQQQELGADTWEDNSWQYMGNTNVWTWMSCDESLGIAYLPFGTPSNDFYGGQRHGDNLFGESLVAVDVKTGKRLWHYQMVHHGLWDYDLPAPPVLCDVTINGKKRKILAQITKQGFVFVLDRITGKAIWNVEDRKVPASVTPGERASATQPIPLNPLPFDRQGIDTSDLIDFTPNLRQLAIKILMQFNYGPLYTPPSEKGTVVLPGNIGGASWSGAAFYPGKGILYVPSITKPAVHHLFKMSSDSTAYAGYFVFNEFVGPADLPLIKPPYGRITAIDLATGKNRWMQPVGEGPVNHSLLKDLKLDTLGSANRMHILLTKTLLLVAQEGTGFRQSSFVNTSAETTVHNSYLNALDLKDGHLIGRILLPASASGAPISYMVNGKQFITVPVGGASQKAELIAFALPD